MAEARRKAKKATEHAKAEKLGTSIEEFTRVVPNEPKNPLNSVNWNSTNNSNGKNSSDETPCVDNSSRPKNDGCHSEHTDLPPNDSKNGFVMGVPSSKLPSLEPNSMLKPVPSSSGPLVSGKPDVTITSKLNLEDFEAESSPFDSIALKTLNDLEELESVLQNVNLNSTVIHEIQTGPSPDLSSELSGVLHTCNNDIVGKTEESPLHNIPADDVCDLKICNTSTALESQQAFFPGPSPVAKDFPSIPSTVSKPVFFTSKPYFGNFMIVLKIAGYC